jgi:hypothetical protein
MYFSDRNQIRKENFMVRNVDSQHENYYYF